MINTQTVRSKQLILAALLAIVLVVLIVGVAVQLQLIDGLASGILAEGIEIANGGSGGVNGGG